MAEEILSGTALQAKKMKDTEEEKAFYRDYTTMYDLNSMKTAFNGYDKKAVREYITKILNEQSEQEKSASKIIDDLRMQIASLKKDKDESVQKYNKLLLAKISGTDTSTGDGGASSEELARAKKECEEYQKKVLMLSGQLSSARSEKAKNDQMIEELNQQIEDLKKDNERIQSENIDSSTLSDAKQLFETQVKDLNSQIEKLKQSNAQLQSDMQTEQNAKLEALASLNELQPRYQDLQNQFKATQEELTRTKDESGKQIEDLKQQVDDLTKKNTELTNLTEYANDMKEALVRSTASEKEAVQARKAAEGKLRALTFQNESIQKENKQLRGSLTQMQQAMEESKNYTEKIEQELSNVYAAQMGEMSEGSGSETEATDEAPAVQDTAESDDDKEIQLGA